MSSEPKIERPKSFKEPEKISESEIYRFLYTYYQHQDRLSWSRTQALGIVEGGILAVAFSKQGLTGSLALLVGTIIIWLIWQLIQRDWEVRDQHLKDLDLIHEPRNIRMRIKPRCQFRRGSFIMKLIIRSIIFINILLAIRFASPCICTLLSKFCGD
jgi:hypothetical protein